MIRSARRLAAVTTLALAAGLVTAVPATAQVAECGPAPAANNNTVGNQAPVANDDRVTVFGGLTVEIPVLANDTDPEGDTLALVSAGKPSSGTACTTESGTIRFTAAVSSTSYTTSFRYGITDGDRYRSATVTVEVTGMKPVTVKVRKKLRRPAGSRVRPAEVAITNPNAAAVGIAVGGRRETIERTVGAGKTVVVKVRSKQAFVLAYVGTGLFEEDFSVVSASTINTRTGRVVTEAIDDGDFFRTATAARRALR